ncbi:MAG: hypothetical protein EBZ49_17060, partial [Proteobacteria bacterium]|nr:hypothetical protein [Pseudomonadota bacterium]
MVACSSHSGISLLAHHGELDSCLRPKRWCYGYIPTRVFESSGPALLFENIKGTNYRAASNIFGTVERSKLIFDSRFNVVKQMIEIRKNPLKALKHPLNN